MSIKDTPALNIIANLLKPLGYTLSSDQPHIGGERALMSAHKLVLIGVDTLGKQVVIKTSSHPRGIQEIIRDKNVRDLLTRLSFAGDELLQPLELWSGMRDGHQFLITEFIDQDAIFVTRPIQEQFFILLRAFEAQEAFHITTRSHSREVERVFGVHTADTYINTFQAYRSAVAHEIDDHKLRKLMDTAHEKLAESKTLLARYSGYLTHNDFVPHNMRVQGRNLYVLDQTSFWFGNKYEGWARLINYMELHNPELASLLLKYVQTSRPQEYPVLRIMRIFKIGTLLSFYASILPKTDGDLQKLTLARITLWATVLEHILKDVPVPPELISEYREERDNLRSDAEKRRQREFAVA